ncbi:MAG TPA: hypothetical protein VGY54_18985, partial [Polyangiaceae bacterium]|nr:hypothetical protein [Polyangiaceae bacterium]
IPGQQAWVGNAGVWGSHPFGAARSQLIYRQGLFPLAKPAHADVDAVRIPPSFMCPPRWQMKARAKLEPEPELEAVTRCADRDKWIREA